MYLNKRQNCTLTDYGTNKNSCENHTNTQCLYENLNYLTNASFPKSYYYPWCYYKPESYMLLSNNRKKNCRWPCDNINCQEEKLATFNNDGSLTNSPRINSITGKNFNWCFYKNQLNKFKTPSIEICNIPDTSYGTYPNCSDCIIKAGGGASCTDILMTPNSTNLNNIGFKHYPLIQIGDPGFDNEFLKVNTGRRNYTWPDQSGNFDIYYQDFDCTYENEYSSSFSCVSNKLKTTFIIPQNSTLKSNGQIPYVIVYGFEQNNAYNWGWPETYKSQYPMFTADSFSNGTPIYNDNNITNSKTYFETIKQIVYSGIAVIGLANNFGTAPTTPTGLDYRLYDYGPYLPGTPPDKFSINSTSYWNNGDNFVNNYLKELMDYIYNDPELDYDRCALMGYSLGAQMVSRLYNQFPSMTTIHNKKFPKISCGIMIAGGTLNCYDSNPNICPSNKTEPIYDNGNRLWEKHPATLLFQNIPDPNADKEATNKYFNTLAHYGVPCYLVNKKLKNSAKHAIAVCNNKWDNNSKNANDLTLTITILFLLKYL